MTQKAKSRQEIAEETVFRWTVDLGFCSKCETGSVDSGELCDAEGI